MMVTVEKVLNSVTALRDLRQTLARQQQVFSKSISVCGGTGCQAYQCQEVFEAFEQAAAQHNLTDKVRLRATGCHGFCELGPLAVVHPAGIFYQRIKPQDVEEIVEKTLLGGEVIERLLYSPPRSQEKIVHEREVPFYKHQQRLVFGQNGVIDPTDIDDYIAAGGYEGLAMLIENHSPQSVVDLIERSGLRGRGGGFPCGRKWAAARRLADEVKYFICNADEGNPGAYMDRSILEGNPHRVLEGMIIGAYAIGATTAYIYVRSEYPLALRNAKIAIDQATERGLLGPNILGSGISLQVHLSRGAGAFVCGEETALIASIEGRPGIPSQKPPYPAECGLWGKPTIINDVETLANVPLIVERGADWFSGIGTEGSKGTKVFSLVGKVNNTGLIEVPMGISLRDVIFKIGGGVPGERKLKAVQTGGPSGGLIPEHLLDLPVDFDAFAEAGAMMGNGGMIVVDDRTCVVDLARNFMNFLREKSCGKCTPCRENIRVMLDILSDICGGRSAKGDLARLETLAVGIKAGSLCGLGNTAPNPVISTLRYFREEYLAHINEHRCPAGVCTQLISFEVQPAECKACGKCVKVCPAKAISGGSKKVAAVIDEASCIRCRACFETCPFEAVNVRSRLAESQLQLETWRTNLPLVACAACGREFVTQRLLAQLAPVDGRQNSPPTCPRCRSRQTGRNWAMAVRLEAASQLRGIR